jgi:hypothetical protein
MLTWEYLKANPQKVGRLLNTGWHELFTDPETPYAIKQELVDLQKADVPITDATLYFHGKYALQCFVKGEKPVEMPTVLYCRRWMDALYTYYQHHYDEDEKIYRLFIAMSGNVLDMTEEELSSKDMLAFCNFWVHYYTSINSLQVALFCSMRGIQWLSTIDTIPSSSMAALFEYMTIDFIKTAELGTIARAIDLFRDVSMPTEGKYKSLADIQKVHDDKAELAVKKLLSSSPSSIKYDPAFLAIVEAHGFKLPATKNDLIERGARHHNCVASYADRHMRQAAYDTSVTRLVLNDQATAELSIHISHDKIVAVMCPQYKGAYNKDVAKPEALTDLRIALTGQSVDILHSMEVEHERRV